MKSEEALAEVTGNLDSVPLLGVSPTSPTPSPFDHVFAHLNRNRMGQWQTRIRYNSAALPLTRNEDGKLHIGRRIEPVRSATVPCPVAGSRIPLKCRHVTPPEVTVW